MKLKLPKHLISAIIALGALAQGVPLSNSIFNNNGGYRGNSLEVSGTVSINNDYYWSPEGNGIMSGNGTITSAATYDDYNYSISLSGNVTIGSGIKFKNFDLYVHNATINATFDSNCCIELYGGTCNLTNAVFNEIVYLTVEGGTIIHPNLEINKSIFYFIQDKSSTLKGNLICNGGNMLLHGNLQDMTASNFGGLIIDWYDEGGFISPTLTITGSLIIKSDTPVIFLNEGRRYAAPNRVVIACKNLKSQSALGKLKPFFAAEGTGNIDFQKGYQFEARAGENGYTNIYLVKGNTSTPNFSGGSSNSESSDGAKPPSSAGITVNSGQTVFIPAAPGGTVNMQGGTANATSAPDSILNAGIFKGNSGTVLTTPNQKFSMDGSQDIGYSITGPNADEGANLSIGENGGSAASIRLKGANYNSALTTVGNGTLTISEGTTLGLGENSKLKLKGRGSNTTNFGKVKANVDMGTGSTFLNQGTIDGIIAMSRSAILINNGTLNGDVTIASEAKAYGSGTYNGITTVENNGLLYVGNSPGYQKHDNLVLKNGAKLGFYIDGTTPATLSNNGSGTHSFLSASGALTLEGVVNVDISIGLGLVFNGAETFSVTLMKADPAKITATDADFKATITEGEELLEEGSAKLTWQEELGELVFSATVSEEALAMVTSGDFANTLWAGAEVVKDFATTATKQFLIGKPGQTTAWGAALGSFINHSGKDGFDYDGYGYAVGIQHAFSEQFRAGCALGQTFGTFKSDSGRLKSDQTGIMAAVTAQYVQTLNQGQDSWGISGYMAYGSVKNDAKSTFLGKTEWDDSVFALGLQTDYRTKISENSSLTFFTGIEYTYGSQDTISFRNGGKLTDGRMQTWSIPVGITLRTQIDECCLGSLIPEITVAYVGHVSQQAPTIRANNYKMRGNSPGRSEFMLNAGANWLIDENWSVGLFYNLETRSNATNHSGNLSVRYAF